jgi:hypothetical protein
MTTVLNRDTGEIVATYKTRREALGHVERFPNDRIAPSADHLYACKCGESLADGRAAREHARNGCTTIDSAANK